MRMDREQAGRWARLERIQVALRAASADASAARYEDEWRKAAQERDRWAESLEDIRQQIDAAAERAAWACGRTA